jgi:DNA-binding SARP family transcriptional activator
MVMYRVACESDLKAGSFTRHAGVLKSNFRLVQFRVLGEVGVVDDQGSITPITANRPRALLALLIMNANRSMSYPTLAGALWGEAQPEVPYAALQVVVSRLRSRLGEFGDRIQAQSGGYRLEAADGETDLLVAQTLLQDGRAALERDETSRAVAIFERALALWTGDALEDLTELPFAADWSGRLRDLWLDVIEARNDAVLRSGRHLEVLVGIDALLESEPLREHLRAQQVAALYRAGRQAEALRACESLRVALRDELGVEPSLEMVELERRVLDQDPSLLPTEAGFMTPLPAWTMEVLPFVGRGAEYRQVLTSLAAAVESEFRFVLVEGPPGVGKSRFLLQIARRVARDAIVIPVHVHDVFSPAIYAFAQVLAEATLRVSDEELVEVLSHLPDAPQDVAAIRAACVTLASGQPAQQVVREDTLLQSSAPWIAALSAKAPVVLIVDDLDSAGSALLHVMWQLSTVRMPRRVLVVGSARDDRMSTGLDRTLAALERRHLIDYVSLAPLDPGEIEEMLDRMHVANFTELAVSLHDLTGGNPFLLAEALSMDSPEQVVEQWSCPPQLRDVMRQRIAELGRATAELLTQASLFGLDFTIDVLADATDTSVETIRTLVDRAIAAHILQPSTLRSYRFAHRLFRHALVAEQSATQRAAGHRRIAMALERAGARPAHLAVHWNGTSGPDVPAKVAQYARAAGHESIRLFEPASAAKWYALALEHLPDAERGAVLAELAQAQQLAGDPRGHENMQEAASIALATGDDDLTLRIVRATAPGWSTLPRLEDDHTDRLLARALEVVHDDATRARILARQAVDLSLFDSVAAEELSAQAVALARKTGDRHVVYETLLRMVSVSQAPHTLDARRRALREMFDMGLPSTDVATRYFSLSAAVVAGVQACDVIDVERLSAEADAIADSYDIAPMQWSAILRRAWRAGLRGDLDRADKLITDASDYGKKCAIVGSAETAFIQRGILRWHQGRLPEMLPFVRATVAAAAGQFPGIALVAARVMAECELYDEARAVVEELGATGLDELRRGPMWSSALIITAETACILGLPGLSRAVRDSLEPFADQVAFTGAWVTAPIAYGVGLGIAGCGGSDAGPMLERAADVADRLGAPVLASIARETPPARRG